MKVTAKGQITIPQEVRRDFDIKPGDTRAEELGITDIVVASTRGGTAVKAIEVFKGYNVVVVPHVTSLRKPGVQEFSDEMNENGLL